MGQMNCLSSIRTKCKCVLLCLVLFGSIVLSWPGANAHAQGIKEDRALWFALFFDSRLPKIHKDLLFSLDIQMRFSQFGEQFAQGLFRPSLGYALPYGLSVFLGYAWIPSATTPPNPLQSEHRIWQQLNWSWKFHQQAILLFSRTRLEQRFATTSSDVSVRLRQFIRASWFFHPKSPVGIGVGDEVFLSFNEASWSKATGLSQNRFFAALLLQIHPAWRFESGYLHQWLGGASVSVNHVLFFQFFIFTG